MSTFCFCWASDNDVIYVTGDGMHPSGTAEAWFASFEGALTFPEPSSLAMLTIGAVGLFGFGWRRKRKQAA